MDALLSEGKIPLKGIAVGDGFNDPISQVHFGNVLQNLGLVDKQGRKYFEVQEHTIRNFILKGKFAQGFEIFDKLMGFTFAHGKRNNTFYNFTGLEQYYNFLLSTHPPSFENHVKFLDKNNCTRRSLHVGNQPYTESSNSVLLSLRNDILQSCKSSMEDLLNSKLYKVLIYNGQLDLIVSPPSVNSFLRQLKWYGSQEFSGATKTIWRVNQDIAGYKKSYGNLTHILIRNAGHIVPYDQPQWALKMINEFIQED